MKQLQLHNLNCAETQELRADEIRLEAYADGRLNFVARKKMSRGQSWAINGIAAFEHRCTIRLFEEDAPFPGGDDDLLGVADVWHEASEESADSGPSESGEHSQSSEHTEHSDTVTFSERGAAYTLDYSVTDRQDLAQSDLAAWATDLFERSTESGIWQAIDKSSLVSNLRRRRETAAEIDQVKSSFCGPTSVAYELARTQPQRYVELCRQLYETGGFWSRTKRVEAGQRLLADGVGQGMEPADWMLIATMRNAENTLFKVESDATGLLSGLQGMTLPWEIKGWAKEILLKDVVDIDMCVIFGELKAIERAQAIFDRGGSSFILLNMAVLKKGDKFLPPYPDHWVVYQGNLDTSDADNYIAFDVYTWGRVMPLKLTRKRFERSMFCVVNAI